MPENWKTSKVKNVIACVALLAAFKLVGLSIALKAILPARAELAEVLASGAPIWSSILEMLILALISFGFMIATIWALRKNRLWGLYAAALIAILYLPTILFPISFLIGWYLLPDEWRAWVKSDLLPLMKKEIQSEKSGT